MNERWLCEYKKGWIIKWVKSFPILTFFCFLILVFVKISTTYTKKNLRCANWVVVLSFKGSGSQNYFLLGRAFKSLRFFFYSLETSLKAVLPTVSSVMAQWSFCNAAQRSKNLHSRPKETFRLNIVTCSPLHLHNQNHSWFSPDRSKSHFNFY